jgi:RNA polymerase sigma-70 factor, ECF subfamily
MADDVATSAEFQDLALPLFDSLYNFARWLTKSCEEAEDLVQETYLKALRGFSSFQPGTNFRAWIFQILRNTFLASRSGLAQRMTVPLDIEDEPHLADTRGRTAESLFIVSADIGSVRLAIERLPLIFREVILLSDVEEMTYREIAEALFIPMGTVMSRLARARKAIRSTFAKSNAGSALGSETEGSSAC